MTVDFAKGLRETLASIGDAGNAPEITMNLDSVLPWNDAIEEACRAMSRALIRDVVAKMVAATPTDSVYDSAYVSGEIGLDGGYTVTVDANGGIGGFGGHAGSGVIAGDIADANIWATGGFINGATGRMMEVINDGSLESAAAIAPKKVGKPRELLPDDVASDPDRCMKAVRDFAKSFR